MTHAGEFTEKALENDIAEWLVSGAGGWTRGDGGAFRGSAGAPAMNSAILAEFVRNTQPKAWARFLSQERGDVDPAAKFARRTDEAIRKHGLVHVLRHGFSHRGITFRPCFFEPESGLNAEAARLYGGNICSCVRQWRYSGEHGRSVDMMLAVNGIPVAALELKDQNCGQCADDARRQWMEDRDPRDPAFRPNRRILLFLAADLTTVLMTTRLAGAETRFLPLNQGSAGAGRDGGAGNPPNPHGHVTAHLWEKVLQRDSLLEIIRKFLIVRRGEDGEDRIIFPRYHQLDVVRRLVGDVRERGPGRHYLIQHSAGSGKSNSIAWTAHRLASLHDADDRPVFSSVIVLTDRTVLDRQLQETVAGVDHARGLVETIGPEKTSRDLLRAIVDGRRIIVSTLQKFPVIYREIPEADGRNYAVIVDEAHSGQTGSAAASVRQGLADRAAAVREEPEAWGGAEEEPADGMDALLEELAAHGRHRNLSFLAFTATPKRATLEIFGRECEDGTFRPFHVYSMRQAVEEGFILDVLAHYASYETCYRIARSAAGRDGDPDVPAARAAAAIRRFEELHPSALGQKAAVAAATYLENTRLRIGGLGRMMVVTGSRLAAVRWFHALRRCLEERGEGAVPVFVAFSGAVRDPDTGEEWTEPDLNRDSGGRRVPEDALRRVFHDEGGILVVAEKYQTGFDEPLLHTMIVDRRLRDVKAVQTLSRLNRTFPGKRDTFVLDFVNTEKDMAEAFAPFHRETVLMGEIDVDMLYERRSRLREAELYDDGDVRRVAEIRFAATATPAAQGRVVSALGPVIDRYRALDEAERARFRVDLRSFVKLYGHISQIVRLFDADLHMEAAFAERLEKILPEDAREPFSLDGRVFLEYHRIRKTFEGSVAIPDGRPLEAAQKAPAPEERRSPLDEVIARINELHAGEFTEADRVMVGGLLSRLSANDTLRRRAGSMNRGAFLEIFPEIFDPAAADAHVESEEAFARFFEDTERYAAIRQALGERLFRAFAKEAAAARSPGLLDA